MKVIETGISGLKVIELDVYCDERGYFSETYNAQRYAAAGIGEVFVQDNERMSLKGVIRGLHWQTGKASQAKLVRVVRGSVLDVAVDLRKDSPTYGKHFSIVLSGENKKQYFIPRGFAHGFIVLEDNTIFSYKCDNVYDKSAERGMRFDDPELGIEWPDIGVPLILSEKDKRHPNFRDVLPEVV
ncbi:MAG: dTDP-4-dehydrorhamnose 3,5-epimerase [Kiritimatiellae bacterium]|nr:dTDP-4-dehydrorhamnose 3,5-epimerase [Kiritimatiellia bacterium]